MVEWMRKGKLCQKVISDEGWNRKRAIEMLLLTPQLPPLLTRPLQGVDRLLGKRPQLWFFGDSITERASSPDGWVTFLGHVFSRKADLFNRGFSGYNTKHGLAMIKQYVKNKQQESGSTSQRYEDVLMTIFFGANDACNVSVAWQGVPVEEYEANLEEMVQLLLANLPGITLIIIAPPPVDSISSRWRKSRSNANTGEYAATAVKVAQKTGVMHIDLWTDMQNKGGDQWTDYLDDGLHFGPTGQKFLYDEIISLLSSDARGHKFAPDHMHQHYPSWNRFHTFASSDRTIEKICAWPDDKGRYCIEGGLKGPAFLHEDADNTGDEEGR